MLHLSPAITAYILVLAALLGLVMGSFTGCLAFRSARGGSVLNGRSECASCGHTLGARDLIPVLSFFLLRGKCRYCGERISPLDPVCEALLAAAYVSIVARYDVGWDALRFLVLLTLLLAVALVDLERYEVPDGLLLAGAANFLLLGVLPAAQPLQALGRGLLGAFAAAIPLLLLVLLMDRALKKETMGGGDIKLFFVAGLYFSWGECILLLLLSCLIGIVLALLFRRRGAGDAAIPFAPAIALSVWLCALFSAPLLSWYLSLFF